jgi:geranyl-CoA carboxylase alpha subunit
MDEARRRAMGDAATAAAKAIGYVGAGTVEFIAEQDGTFYFMEMNTRLQVEHPVTEAITGADLVEWQLRVAMGERFTKQQSDIHFSGHAIEARLCAEDPADNFLPQAGRVALWRPAGRIRTDHALESGAVITPHYDSMIAKVIARGKTRDEARERLARSLDETIVLGVATNKAFLAAVLRDDEFAARGATTDFLGRRFAAIEAAKPDAATLASAAVLRAATAGYGEWNSWSNNPGRAMRVKFGETDIALRFANGAYHASSGGSDITLRIASLDPPHARVALDQIDETVVFAIEGETIHLARAGRSHSLENTIHAPPQTRAAAASDGRLVAPMNGRVVAVNAKAGETVEAGRALVVLEAMKMEHALNAPAASRVKALHVAPGAQVKPGQLLVELDPPA